MRSGKIGAGEKGDLMAEFVGRIRTGAFWPSLIAVVFWAAAVVVGPTVAAAVAEQRAYTARAWRARPGVGVGRVNGDDFRH